MYQIASALLTIAVGLSACVGYFCCSNFVLDKVIFPATNIDLLRAVYRRRVAFLIIVGIPLVVFIFYGFGTIGTTSLPDFILIILVLAGLFGIAHSLFPKDAQTIGDNIRKASQLRPWLFLFPALFAVLVYLAYPVIETLRISFLQREGTGFIWVGFENYQRMFAETKFHEAMINNLLWLLVVPAVSTGFGLLIAQLADRTRWGNIAKSLIFMPMAISFVGAAVIWKLVYDARPVDLEQIGILNALYLALGGAKPQTWLTILFYNNFFLMAVLVWIQTGFAMVILSAALRGIPEETIEAAVIDGANPFQIFFKIKVPQIRSTIVLVWTAITITVLKVFDIVFAMTNGQWETQVLANYMFDKIFRANDWGIGASASIIIMLLVLPILVWNIVQARREMQ